MLHDLGQAGALTRQVCRYFGQPAEADGYRARIDDGDALRVDRLGSAARHFVRAAESRRQVDAHHRVVLLQLLAKDRLEGHQTRRAGARQRLAGAQTAIEVGLGQVDLVAVGLAIPVDDQRHHGHAETLVDRRLQVRRAVGDQQPGGGQDRLLLDAADAPQLHVALAVGALGVDDAYAGPQRPHRRQPLAGERAVHERDRRVPGQVGAGVAAQDRERQVGRTGGVGRGHARMGVLLEPERLGPALFDRLAQAV